MGRHDSGSAGGESSVEEILASIKKVIARDNRSEAMDTRRRRARAGISEEQAEPADAEEAAEVLELSDAELADAELADADFADDDTAFEEDLDFSDDPHFGTDRKQSESLVDAGARRSMQDSFAALAMLSEPGAAPQIVRSGETSLEEMTRALLKPMLAQWLDANLPDMVEKLVRAEIERIAGKRG